MKQPMIAIEYAAGFFDADGCVFFDKEKNTYGIDFGNNHKEVLVEIKHVLDMKSTVRENTKKGYTTTFYRITTRGRREVLRIAKLLLPYSIVKREGLKKAILHIERKLDEPKQGNYGGWRCGRGGKGRRLTKNEEQFIIDNPDMKHSELAKSLGVPYHQVYYARIRLQEPERYRQIYVKYRKRKVF